MRLAIAIDEGTPFGRELVRWAANRAAMNVVAFRGHEIAAFERAILQGSFDAVIDAAIVDMASPHAPDRLTAAGLKGIAQVIVPVGLAQVPPRWLDNLGREIAEKASAAAGPTHVVLAADAPAVLRQSLRNSIYPCDLLVESTFAEDDPAWVNSIVESWMSDYVNH